MGGDGQGVGGGIKFPGGLETTGVEGMTWGYETWGVTPEGNGVTGGDGEGQGGDKNSAATQAAAAEMGGPKREARPSTEIRICRRSHAPRRMGQLGMLELSIPGEPGNQIIPLRESIIKTP